MPSRIDIIGQNGNEGEHYMDEVTLTPEEEHDFNTLVYLDAVYHSSVDFMRTLLDENEGSLDGITHEELAFYRLSEAFTFVYRPTTTTEEVNEGCDSQ